MRKIVFVALCAIAVFGCKKASGEYFDYSTVAVTGEAVDLTPFSATLICNFNITSSMNPDKWGVVGSTDPNPARDNSSFGYSMSSDEVAPEYRFEISSLEPETTYYYRAFMELVGIGTDPVVYGEIRQFTTPAVGNLGLTESPILGSTCAILRGSLPDYLKNAPVQVWFRHGKAFPDRTDEGSLQATINMEDGTFSADYIDIGKEVTYYCQAGFTYGNKNYFGEEKTFQVADFVPTEGDLIDMGLSVKWGSRNVGASDPGKDGDYFAWGETQTKETFLPDNYLYNETPTQLPLTADAASVNLGGSWRMPTKEEYEEIINGANTLHETGVYNGRYGYMYISRKNGNRIFFPCSGWKNEEGVGPVGTSGEYWTSTFSTSTDNYNVAYLWTVGSGSTYFFGPVYYGLTVRGVQE